MLDSNHSSLRSRSYHDSLAGLRLIPSVPAREPEALLSYETLGKDGRAYTPRLDTDELIPSFRDKCELYELMQEISDAQRAI